MGHMDICHGFEPCGKWRARQRKRSGVSLVSCMTVIMPELKAYCQAFCEMGEYNNSILK